MKIILTPIHINIITKKQINAIDKKIKSESLVRANGVFDKDLFIARVLWNLLFQPRERKRCKRLIKGWK